MVRSFTARVLAGLLALLLVTMGFITAAVSPAAAAGGGAMATVPNGITTTDLAAVGMSPTTLAQDLAGAGVTVSNVTYTGAKQQAGRIHVVDPAVVSFNDGVIMSSGNIADVVGPNKSDSTTGDMAGAGDPTLDALIQNTQTVNPATYDASVLQFDFVPTASQVYFTYTFGSDEYLEWVNLFNDVFGFFVNGTNCATTPSGAPVSIDTINSQVNPNLFRDNSFSSPPANPINIESDGLSVELVCSAPVNVGQVNHMKLAIADTSDQILDSVVMIKANSLSTVKPEACNDGVDNNDDTLVDGNDPKCRATTTPAPAIAPGVGSGGQAPAFTGNEGTPVVLDAAALGWTATPDTVSTTWTVTGINGTIGTCTVDPIGPVALNPDGSIAVVHALCPKDGEYVAHVWGWDVESQSSFDYDVDFFVHNAPPAVSIDSPAIGTTVNAGQVVTLSATVADPSATDSVTCIIDWGDGTSTAVPYHAGSSSCAATHTFSAEGSAVVTITATDGAKASAAAATVLSIAAAVTPGAPVITSQPSDVTAIAGTSATFTAAASGAPTPTVQWQRLVPGGSWTNMTGAKGNSLSFKAAVADDAKQYRAVYSNALGGPIVTDVATLHVIGVSTMSPKSGGVGASVTLTGVNLADVSAVTFAGTGSSAPFTVVSSTRIITAVPVGSVAGPIVLDTPTGSVSTPIFTPAITSVIPKVGSFSPTSARAGDATTVTVTGTNLGGASAVRLGSTELAFSVLSATQLQLHVPATGVSTGSIVVTTDGGTSVNSTPFGVLVTPTKLAAGASHSCAVLVDATVSCWGLNSTGQLGDGTKTSRRIPTAVPGLTNVSSVAAGAGFTCAVRDAGPTGTVSCWGQNSSGQLGDGTILLRTTPTTVPGLVGVTAVSAGDTFACALIGSPGSVSCWGASASGQTGVVAARSTVPVVVSGLSGVTFLDAGGSSACAGLASGALRCWGQNSSGQLGDGTTSSGATSTPVAVSGIDGVTLKATSVSVGTAHACAQMLSGGVRCWGLNSSGQLGDGTTINRPSPVVVKAVGGASLSGAHAVAAGSAHTCAILGSGGSASVSCWGLDADGQLGDGSLVNRSFAQTLTAPAIAGVSVIAAGGAHMVALVPSVALSPVAAVGWGANKYGQIGDGSVLGRTTPTALGML